mgnify:CR=1 FL=1
MGFSSATENRSSTQSALLALALASNAGVVTATSGVQAWSGLSQLSRGTRTSMRGTLDIGDLHIPVHTYSRVKQTKLPSLSKRSALGSDTAEVSLERFKTQRTAEGEEVVPEEELVKAYAYGKDLFTVDEAQQQLMKYTSIKELAVLAFIPRAALRVHWFLDTVETVTPEPGDANAFAALASLAESLAASKKVGLCRFVPRSNAAPQLVAMLPPDHAATPVAPGDAGGDAVGTVEADKSRSILYLVSLPFAEDMRDFPFPVLETLPGAPSDEQLAATAELIDALDMDAVPASADGQGPPETLGEATAALPNPTLQRLADTLALRAGGQADAIAPVPEAVAQLLQPNDALFAKGDSAVDGFKSAFPLTRVAGGKRSREAFGGAEDMDMFADLDAFVSGVASAGAEGDAKAARTDAGAAASSSAAGAGVFSSMAQSRVLEIGTVQPKENLTAMLAQGDSPDRAIGMFVSAVGSLLCTPTGVERALECLQFLRPLAVQHGVVSSFNACLDGIRAAGKEALTASPAQAQAWSRLQELHIAPVTVSEAPSAAGAVSVADAQAFFAAAPTSFAAPSMTQSGPADAGGDDSDFDDLS